MLSCTPPTFCVKAKLKSASGACRENLHLVRRSSGEQVSHEVLPDVMRRKQERRKEDGEEFESREKKSPSQTSVFPQPVCNDSSINSQPSSLAFWPYPHPAEPPRHLRRFDSLATMSRSQAECMEASSLIGRPMFLADGRYSRASSTPSPPLPLPLLPSRYAEPASFFSAGHSATRFLAFGSRVKKPTRDQELGIKRKEATSKRQKEEKGCYTLAFAVEPLSSLAKST